MNNPSDVKLRECREAFEILDWLSEKFEPSDQFAQRKLLELRQHLRHTDHLLEMAAGAKEVCHQLREAICHLVHEGVFDSDSSVIQEMEAAIDNYNRSNV